MPGPAATIGDKITATDTHIVLVPSPGGPVPTPTPLPFVGIINSNCSPNVLIGGKPAATVGSTATNTPPHFVSPPTTFQNPPTNLGTIIMGSATVLINNKAAARAGDLARTCNDPTPMPIGTVIGTAATVIIGP